MSALSDPQSSLRAKIDAQLNKYELGEEEKAQDTFLADIWPKLKDDYEGMVEKMKTKYDKLLKLEDIDGMIEGRVKSNDSIRKSMIRRKNQRKDNWDSFREMMDEVHDLAAIRIIVDYPHDLTRISRIISDSATLYPKAEPNLFLADRPVGTYWAAWFGAHECENHHVEAHYPDDDPVRYYNEVTFEIQITCLPAHLHNKIAHSLQYKGQGGRLSRGDEIVIDLTRGLGLCYSLCLYYKSEKLLSDRDQLMNEPVSILDQQAPGTGFGPMPMKLPNIPGLNDLNVKELPSRLFREAIKNSSAISGQDTSVTVWDSLVSELSRAITDRQKQPSLPSTEEQQLLDSVISKLPFERMGDREGNIECALESTCSWLLDNPTYREWLMAEVSTEPRPFFWIKGKAGSGKSVMMKFLTEKMKEISQEDNVMSFFFSARGEERTTQELYRSILYDLFESEPDLKKNVDSLGHQNLKRISQSGWDIRDLKRVLSCSLTNRQANGRLSLLIDALDECDEDEIRDMFRFFGAQKPDTLRICLASRPYPEIGLAGCHHLVLEEQQYHTSDIRAYIHDQLKIFDISESEAQSVKDKVLKKCSGIFLWVVLVIPLLQKVTDKGEGDSVISLMEALEQTPNGLNELFRDMIQRDGQDLSTVCLTLRWILFSRGPLHPQELRTAVLLGKGEEPQNGNPEVLRKFVLGASRGLAEITKSSRPTVQFIHESVREFLLRNHHLYSQSLEGSFEGQSHDILANICSSQIRQSIGNVENPADLPPVWYAMTFVFRHANFAQQFGVRQDKFLSEFPLRSWIERTDSAPDTTLLYILAEHGAEHLISIHPDRARHLKVKGGKYHYPFFAAVNSSFTLESANALFGLPSGFKQHPVKLFVKADLILSDGCCCPIMHFIRFAQYPLLRHILESHEYEAPCSKHGLETGLFTRKVHEEELMLICCEFAEKLNFLGRYLRFNTAHDLSPTPKTQEHSYYQSFYNDVEQSDVIKTSGYTTEQNSKPRLSQNLQQSLKSSLDVLRRTFRRSASSEPTSCFQHHVPEIKGLGQFQRVVSLYPEILYTPLKSSATFLDLAIEMEFPTLISLIISMIINTKNGRGAMSAAVSAVTARTIIFEWRCNIVRRLVDASFNLDLQILLQHASQPLRTSKCMNMDDWRMMEFLVNGFEVLEIGSKVNEEQTTLNSPTKGKVTRDSSTIAQLMKHGLKLCDIDGNESTILHVLTDIELLAHILATYDIDINAKDRRGYTAILVAATMKAFDRVTVFLDAGADINATDNDGSTLLHHCIENEAILGRMLDKNIVDVNAKNQLGNTALYTAVKAKACGIVKRLLNAGACSNIRDVVMAIKVESYECIEALIGSIGHTDKTPLLVHSIDNLKEKMFDKLLVDDTLMESTKEELDELLKTVVIRGNVQFVKRIVNYRSITIDPSWLRPLVSLEPQHYYYNYRSCEILRHCLNEMKTSMNGKLPRSGLIPLQLAREHRRHDMVFLMEAFLRDEPLTKAATIKGLNKLDQISNQKRFTY
ncbi:hypothetical protein FSHL1_009809 [Fusarium sambucinum]